VLHFILLTYGTASYKLLNRLFHFWPRKELFNPLIGWPDPRMVPNSAAVQGLQDMNTGLEWEIMHLPWLILITVQIKVRNRLVQRILRGIKEMMVPHILDRRRPRRTTAIPNELPELKLSWCRECCDNS
jgi:hypothetical protein